MLGSEYARTMRSTRPHQITPSTVATFAGNAVHARLREAILGLELPPGCRVATAELLARYDTDAPTLGAAVDALQQEGLLDPVVPDGAIVVKPLSMDDLEQLYSLRIIGESDAVAHTVPILDPAACDVLADELRVMDGGDSLVARAAHRRFHEGLRVGVGEARARELQRLFEHAERYQLAVTQSKQLSRAQEEHRAILRACFEGDRELAADLLAHHCADTAYELVEMHEPGRRTPSIDVAIDFARAQAASLS
jgi:DNA-binding GntR family transcriptional regulator